VSSNYEENTRPAFEGLAEEDAHPVAGLVNLASSPIKTFFYFMPKSLWKSINYETNRYGIQQVTERAAAIHAKQRISTTGVRRETLKQIIRRLKAKKAYETQ
jgi:hypothetical protein